MHLYSQIELAHAKRSGTLHYNDRIHQQFGPNSLKYIEKRGGGEDGVGL